MCPIAKFKLWEARHTYGVSAMRADFVVYKSTVIQINANRFATSSFPINVPMVHPTAVSMDLDNFRIAQYC